MSSAPPPALPDRWLESVLLGAAEKAELGVVVTLLSEGDVRQVFVNAFGAALLGCSREEFLARPPFQNFVGGFRDQLPGVLARAAAGQKLEPFEAVMARPDGSTLPLEVSIATVLIEGKRFAVSFFRDTTARHAADAALISSEARFRALVEGAPDGVVITRDGVILYLNPAAVRLLGYDTKEELVGQSMNAFLDPEGIQRMIARIREMRGGAHLGPADYRARRRDGTTLVAEITSLPIDFEGGPAVIAFARDVTERARLQDQLARADRLASLGTLAAGVAHEVNNPLTFMALGLELCARRIQSSNLGAAEKEHLVSILADVRAGADRVALVVRDLKTFSRVTEDAAQEVDVREVIDAAVRIVAHRSRHFAEVAVTIGVLPPVRANAARLEQVFVNLLLNAVQAFEEARPENRIEVRGALDPAGTVVIDVVDNGPGIPSDVVSRIFDPFFTTKPVGEGTGLGLAIVHGLLEQMGGSVSVEDAGGHGAWFRVRLPTIASGGERASAGAAASDVVTRRTRVLVVDDEREVARVIQRSLEPRHEVVAVTSAKEALELLLSGEPFEVVLCDLAMPGMSGTELYRQVTAARPELGSRFVIISGGAVSGRIQSFLDAWVGPRLEKPFTRAELEAALAAIVDRRGPDALKR